MALIHCNFHSDVLGMASSMCVILPQSAKQSQAGAGETDRHDGHPVLYLLHGLSDDHTIWQRRTSIERYAASLDLAIVMPNVHRSFYTDTATGGRYWTFVSEELPTICHSFFPLSTRRADTFVAGLSMGGYGAFKLALSHPEAFAAAASLSGALDVARLARTDDSAERTRLARIFGDLASLPGSRNDLFRLAEDVAADGPPPMLHQCCGTEDFLYEDHVSFSNHLRCLGLECTVEEGPGTHEWGYWDQQIQRVLDWLPLAR